MYFKVFEYGHNSEKILEFLQFWIRSDNFLKDIKIGDCKSIRNIDHTIRIIKNGEFEISIEKGVIVSDGPRKSLEDGEFYLNKGRKYNNLVKELEKWLQDISDLSPYLVNREKTLAAKNDFEFVGICFYIETPIPHARSLNINADVIGLPK